MSNGINVCCYIPNRIMIQVDGVTISIPYTIEEESRITPEEIKKISEAAINAYREACKS